MRLKNLRDTILNLGHVEGSVEWIAEVIRTFNIEPTEWQSKYAHELFKSKDVFLTAETGSGKSTLVHAVILARQLLGEPCRALVVEPTCALDKDQVSF